MAVSQNWLHVVPDDELHLASFHLGEVSHGELYPLFPGRPALPDEHKERKRLKPDLESLTLLNYQEGPALLSLGSGSTRMRHSGVLQPLSRDGRPSGAAVAIDLSTLYEALPYKELNIEGVAATENLLHLVQRGNSNEGINALVTLDLGAALEFTAKGNPWTPELLINLTRLELPTLGGVRLTLTDVTTWDQGHLLLSAAAEDTTNPYDDGTVIGSVLGLYRLKDGRLQTANLEGAWKIEGVERLADGRIFMVTDADDPNQPALLLEADNPFPTDS